MIMANMFEKFSRFWHVKVYLKNIFKRNFIAQFFYCTKIIFSYRNCPRNRVQNLCIDTTMLWSSMWKIKYYAFNSSLLSFAVINRRAQMEKRWAA